MGRNTCLCHGGKLSCSDIFTYVVLFLLAVVPQILFIVAFSAIGHGEHFWYFLRNHHHTFVHFWTSGASTLLVLYLLDFSHWKGRAVIVRNALCSLVVIAILVGSAFSAEEHPATPMLMFVIGNNMFFWIIRWLPPCRGLHDSQFLLGLSYSVVSSLRYI